jgi:hypothetical protein
MVIFGNESSGDTCMPAIGLVALTRCVLLWGCIMKIACALLQDSTYKYYEIILVDTEHKVIREVGPWL